MIIIIIIIIIIIMIIIIIIIVIIIVIIIIIITIVFMNKNCIYINCFRASLEATVLSEKQKSSRVLDTPFQVMHIMAAASAMFKATRGSMWSGMRRIIGRRPRRLRSGRRRLAGTPSAVRWPASAGR